MEPDTFTSWCRYKLYFCNWRGKEITNLIHFKEASQMQAGLETEVFTS